MARNVIGIFFFICATSFVNAHNSKDGKNFKKYTYIIEASTGATNANHNYALAVKIKGWPYLLTSLHTFYKTDTPGQNFSHYYLSSITGDITKRLLKGKETNVKYIYALNLNGEYSSEKCTVAKIDLKRDLALLNIPKSMHLKDSDGVEFVDISASHIDTLDEDNNDLSMVGVSRSKYSLHYSGRLSSDLSDLTPSGNLSKELIELLGKVKIPEDDSFSCIKLSGGVIKNGFSGGPVYFNSTKKMVGVLWGGASDYDNIAIIPKYSEFKDSLTNEERAILHNAFKVCRYQNHESGAKSLMEYEDPQYMDTLRWYFPYGVVTKRASIDFDLQKLKSPQQIILASVIYFNNYLNKSKYKTGNPKLTDRLIGLRHSFAELKDKGKDTKEMVLMRTFHSSHPVTVAMISLNGLFFEYNSNKKTGLNGKECDSIYSKLDELTELISNPENIRNDETKAWKILGFNVMDYIKRMTNYINNLKCKSNKISLPPTTEECNISLAKLKRAQALKLGLREAYIESCNKCINVLYCDSAGNIPIPTDTSSSSKAGHIECDSIINLAIKYADPLLRAFYADYGLSFKMPSVASELPIFHDNEAIPVLSFKLIAGKDLGSASANALVENYKVSQASLDDHDKIFNVLNDFIYGMIRILSPILDTNFQHINILGAADGVPYDRPFSINKSLGDISEESVFMVNHDNIIIDTIKFKDLIKPGSTSDDKNYALAFERAYQFKLRLPNSDLSFRIPIHKEVKSKISHEVKGRFRSVEINIDFKIRPCK